MPSAATFVQDLQQRWEEAKAAMQAAQGRQKQQADHRRHTGDIKKIHSTFHASLLKEFKGIATEPEQYIVDGAEEYEVEAVLG